ncbi:MAG: DEAD/DEAH box helicase family protein [Desulfurobacteriaceae bacterium]
MKIEKYLVLNKYFLNLFGFNEFNHLREKLKDVKEDYNSQGRSCFVDILVNLKPEWESELLKYDEAIEEYVKRLRQNRKQPEFNLKYFQYLAVLFTEIFLDKYYNEKEKFLNELNEFLEKFNKESRSKISLFTEEDLKKLAFWMATGSGKTLIMHINYWQSLKYSRNNWDNIILITPNEGLSKQHYREFKLSGIPCKLYNGNLDNLKTKEGEVLIIDIYKLTEEKKGKGISVDISYFDGKNLVFIDEGHKGQKSEEQKWKKLRDKIGEEGFLFEYSATFGQVIGKNRNLLEEYSKAIIFDYSYKYFYADGYGKDFYVYNMKEDAYSEVQEDLLLTAGLLSFYEQLLIFSKYENELKEYNVEKPLWVFVGSKVTGKGLNSDVIRIVAFLNKITTDKDHLKDNIKKIIEGKSGLIDNGGNDIFKDKFKYLRQFPIDEIVESIYQKIFDGEGKLELYDIKNSDGEIGLKTSTAEKYFGVINVGDTNSLKKLIKEAEIEIKDDHFSQSLFSEINNNHSPINILIGSKKFVEGWNSWRVSNMGLINMGKGEGPQIIQLFGRGVRLKGKNYSLKREENPDYKLKVLQTLFIFGLNADYINAFLKTIEKEEIDYEKVLKKENWKKELYQVKAEKKFNFVRHPIKLELDETILNNVKLDLRSRISIAHGLKVESVSSTEKPIEIPDEYINILDWNAIYSEILTYKTVKSMFNLIIYKDVLKKIVLSKKYKVFMNNTSGINIRKKANKLVLEITSFEGIKKLHEIVLIVLREYISNFCRKAS